MPVGKLAIFDEGVMKGTFEHITLIKPTVLSNENSEYTYKFEIENAPTKIYLQVNASYDKRNIINKWRVWLNEFSLTKEFKPNLFIDSEFGSHASLLYDITPILSGKKGKNEITIGYSGTDKLLINSLSLISLIDIEGFKTTYSLSTGCLMLMPGDLYTVNSIGKAYFILKSIEKSSKLIITSQQQELYNETYEDNEIDEIELNASGNLNLKVEKNQKRPIIITSFYTYETISPKIYVNVLPKIDSNKLTLEVENNSDVDLDKLIINVLANGITIYFKTLQPLKIKENNKLEIPIPPNRKNSNIMVRAVAIKAGLRKTFDVKVE